MKENLKKITNLTVNELLNNEIIMPSIYFEKFNKNAKTLEIDLEDKKFNKEMNKLLIKDYESIESYMQTIEKNISTIQKAAKESKKAILEKNVEVLTDIYKQMNDLEKEVEELNSKLFVDSLTNTYNRKWIYNKFLDKNADFKDDGICVLIDICDHEYIEKEYGNLIANNLLIFTTNFIKKKLKEESVDFEIARFIDNQFLIFAKDISQKDIKNLLLNIKQLLLNTTLKSNSGLILKGNFNYYSQTFILKQSSREVFENLYTHSNDE